MSTAVRPTTYTIAPVAQWLVDPPVPYGTPNTPATPASLVCALRLRGVRVYPDLEAGSGLVSHDVDYSDLRPLLAAQKPAIVAYLESELYSQRLLELMAFYGWPAERMRTAWLARLDAGGTRHQFTDHQIARFIEHALDVAEMQPEIFVTIGYSTRQWLRWYPLMAEVADHLAELGATEQESIRALQVNNAHHDLRYEEQDLQEIARYALKTATPAPSEPEPSLAPNTAPVMSLGVLAFAAARSYICAYCGHAGGEGGDADGQAWHKDHVAGLHGPNPFVLACTNCTQKPERFEMVRNESDGI